jgi:predicted Rossmann-fold nucleotide-binding protein
MGGVTFQHPREGVRPVQADSRVLRATGQLYMANETLRGAVHRAGGRTSSLRAAADLVEQTFAQPKLVWGVSGFASIGHPCGAQVDGLERLYRYLAVARRKPVLVCDGGTGAGALAISSVLASEHRITTLGVSPLQGLSSMSPRDHMFVYGQTYQDREVIVGLLPDVLVVFDGGDGSKREAIAAAKGGSRILLVTQTGDNRDPKLLVNSWQSDPDLALAVREKRMIICDSLDGIAAAAEEQRVVAVRSARTFRPTRLAAIRRRFVA